MQMDIGDTDDDMLMFNNKRNQLPDFNYYRNFGDLLDNSVFESK